MSGYFNKLIQSYGPPASAPEPRMPWIANAEPEPVQAMDNAILHASDPAEHKPPDRHQAAKSRDIESPAARFDTQSDFEKNPFVKNISDDSPPKAATAVHVERLSETIIERFPDATGTDPEDAPVTRNEGPDQITHIHEAPETHIHVEETHLHEAAPVTVENDLQVPPTATPEPEPDLSHPHETPGAASREGLLDVLEARLAKAFAQMQTADTAPTASVINFADFEPEGEALPPRVEAEPQRQVTREIVKEVHHHHETRIVPPPKHAPKSAAEASQIGRIRFSSAWDRPGGM